MNINYMIEKIKNKNDLLLEQEYKKLEKTKSFKGGALEVSMIIVIIKILLLTVGTFMLSWWPYVFIIAIYCTIKEYEMGSVLQYDMLQTIIYMIFAFCCPCCWGVLRLFNGWNFDINGVDSSTSGFGSILQNCEPYGLFLNISNLGNGDIKTTQSCYNVISASD
tara:strand:- start:351 stop:842 length:492 start_codon:yes stop_codon:yes gene_type:complete